MESLTNGNSAGQGELAVAGFRTNDMNVSIDLRSPPLSRGLSSSLSPELMEEQRSLSPGTHSFFSFFLPPDLVYSPYFPVQCTNPKSRRER